MLHHCAWTKGACDGWSLSIALCQSLSVLTTQLACSFAYEESVDEVRRVMEKYGPVDSIDMKTGEDAHALRRKPHHSQPLRIIRQPWPTAKALRGLETAVQ